MRNRLQVRHLRIYDALHVISWSGYHLGLLLISGPSSNWSLRGEEYASTTKPAALNLRVCASCQWAPHDGRNLFQPLSVFFGSQHRGARRDRLQWTVKPPVHADFYVVRKVRQISLYSSQRQCRHSQSSTKYSRESRSLMCILATAPFGVSLACPEAQDYAGSPPPWRLLSSRVLKARADSGGWLDGIYIPAREHEADGWLLWRR
jgi:hypothetical protein